MFKKNWLVLTLPILFSLPSTQLRAEKKGAPFALPKKLSPAEQLALSPPTPYSKLPDKVKLKLQRGETVVEIFKKKNERNKEVYVTIARAIIKAPPSEVYSQLSQLNKTHEYMPRLYYSKVQKKLGQNTYYVLRKLKVVWTKIVLNLWVHLVPNKRIEWRLFPNLKNGIRNTVGAFHLEPIEGGKKTFITYSLYTDSGRWVPGFIKKILIKKDLPKVITAIRKRVLSKGRWKK